MRLDLILALLGVQYVIMAVSTFLIDLDIVRLSIYGKCALFTSCLILARDEYFFGGVLSI
jgi:hypothetical protein